MSRDGREIRRVRSPSSGVAGIFRRRASSLCLWLRRGGGGGFAGRSGSSRSARLADGALAEGGVPALSVPLVWRTVLLLGRP